MDLHDSGTIELRRHPSAACFPYVATEAAAWHDSPAAAAPAKMVETIRRLDGVVLSADRAESLGVRRMLERDVHTRIRAAAARQSAAWRKVNTLADWERFRDSRLVALRSALGQFTTPGPTCTCA
jgi:hypothetical protein